MQNPIGKYYDQTQTHYERWWNLKQSMSLHYGIWLDDTRSFREALANTNKIMAEMAGIQGEQVVLDAGCGVGGSCMYLANTYGARAKGVTLSERQLRSANQYIATHKLESHVEILLQDFTNTNFPSSSFDVIWACESLCHLESKPLFVKEAFRLLKPGGKLIVSDFFQSKPGDFPLLDIWCSSWEMAKLNTLNELDQVITDEGLSVIESRDFTSEITPTARRLYVASLVGALPSILYNMLFNATKYARSHYKSGIYQYRALQQGLWKYQMILAEKR